MAKAYLKTAGVLLIGILLGVLAHWLFSFSVRDLYVSFFSESGTDYVSGIENGELRVYGAWRFDSLDQAYPDNSVAVSCRKEAMECAIAESVLGFGGSYFNDIYYLKIQEWEPEGHIKATMTDGCVVQNLSVQVVSGNTTLTQTVSPEATRENCADPESLAGTWELTQTYSSPLSYWKGEWDYAFNNFFGNIAGE